MARTAPAVNNVNLLPHQVTGRDWLVSKNCAYLADEMRVGKSVQSIAAVDVIDDPSVAATPLGNVLVICPASVREQWRRQFRQFAAKQHRVLVLSYEEAVRDHDHLMLPWVAVIVDEAHYIKNRKAKRTTAVIWIANAAQRAWFLSGTPAPNNASELWPVLRHFFPETIKNRTTSAPMDYWCFTKRYCVVRDTPFGIKIEGNRNKQELRDRLGSVFLRRSATILGGTKLAPEQMWLEAGDKLAALTAEVRRELTEPIADLLLKARPDQADVLLARLDGKVRARLQRLTGLAKVPALAERLRHEFESGLDKVVLFAWHTDVIDALMDELSEFHPCVIDGETPAGVRQARVDAFNAHAKNKVFIGQIKAAGVGLDLSAACETVFAEMSWVPGDNEQAAARITGVNQKRATRVRYATLADSVDEKLIDVNRRKMADFKEVFG